MKTYYLHASLAHESGLVWSIGDAEEFHLLSNKCLSVVYISGKRATVVVYSITDCILRWGALKIATDFMSGNYRTFCLKKLEWQNGIPH